MLFKRYNHDNKARRLPRTVHDYMRHRFIFLPEYLDTLRCFEYDGTVNGRQVRCVSIFSPHIAKERHLPIKSKLDLEQHPEMLLFEGYMESQGNAYIADRRVPPIRSRAI